MLHALISREQATRQASTALEINKAIGYFSGTRDAEARVSEASLNAPLI